MKKKAIIRCSVGALLGLAISTTIAIAISLFVGDGNFYAVTPNLVADWGTELNAVLLQSICSLLYGAAWAGASIIWELERWSILRQTVTHLIICSLCTFPIAYFLHWMDRSIFGVFSYLGIFFAVYFIIWASQYLVTKRRIQQINRKVQNNE